MTLLKKLLAVLVGSTVPAIVVAHWFSILAITDPQTIVGAPVSQPVSTVVEWYCVNDQGGEDGPYSTSAEAETPCGQFVAADGETRYLEERVTTTSTTTQSTSTRRFEVLGSTELRVTTADATMIMAAGPTSTGGVPASAECGGLDAEFWIGPSGNDANPGTQAQPWSLSAINDNSPTYAGAVVCVMDGTYNLITEFGQPSGASGHSQIGVVKVDGGTLGDPTVFVAQNIHQAIIDFDRDNVTTSSMQAAVQPLGDNVTIDGFRFDNCNFRCITNFAGGGDNVTIQNNVFNDQLYITGNTEANSAVIYNEDHDDLVITNNYFYQGGAPLDFDRHAMIQTYQITNRVTITNNTFIGGSTDRSGPAYFAKANDTRDVEFAYNCYETYNSIDVLWYDWGDGSSASSYDVHHNVFYRTTGTGWHFMQAADGDSVLGTWNIYNNTFIGPTTQSDTAGIQDLDNNPTQVNYYNNIYDSDSGGASLGDINLPALATIGTMDYNLWPSSRSVSITYTGGSASGLAAWQSASTFGDNSIEGNPSYDSLSCDGGQGFTLANGSAGENAGSDSSDMGAWGNGSHTYVGANFTFTP